MTDVPVGAIVLRPGEGHSLDLGNFAISVKASAGDTGGAFSLLEATEPPGFGPPMHIHHDAAETFYVLEGEYLIFVEDQELTCPAGSVVFVPAGMTHGYRVGRTASRRLHLYTPAAMVGYFEELGDALLADKLDENRLSAIADRYSMEVVGPVPDIYA